MPSLSLDPALAERLGELSDLRHAGQVLAWDQQVMMPAAGAAARGEALGTIRRLYHEMLVDP
jgi:carboxypeptidase Taq